MTAIGRGILAGGLGTLVLDAVTYLDMAVTGRPASSTPARSVQRAAGALGTTPPTGARLEAYGALGGTGVGLGIGVLASLARSAGVRLPAPLGAVAIGAAAMAATDGPMAVAGVSDPRTWAGRDWARDVVPHLAYGAAVRWSLDRIDRPAPVDSSPSTPVGVTPDPSRETPSRLGLLARAATLGVAAGARSSLALAGPAVAAGRARPVVALLSAAELVGDKTPVVPDRLRTGPLAGRVAAGAVGAGLLTRHRATGAGPVTSVAATVLGAAGAVAGAVAGAAWREVAADQGWTWQAGLVEDGVALALTAAACRP